MKIIIKELLVEEEEGGNEGKICKRVGRGREKKNIVLEQEILTCRGIKDREKRENPQKENFDWKRKKKRGICLWTNTLCTVHYTVHSTHTC